MEIELQNSQEAPISYIEESSGFPCHKVWSSLWLEHIGHSGKLNIEFINNFFAIR